VRWRFPYHRFEPRRAFPTEADVMAEWGHVRRCYTRARLEDLLGPAVRWSTFINPVSVISHDVEFSRLPRVLKRAVALAAAPIGWAGYALHPVDGPGTEVVGAWRRF
jgi:hypothetical protein